MLITLREAEYLPVLDEWVGNADFNSFVCILGETLSRGDHVINTRPILLERLSAWSVLSRDQREALRTMARSIIRRKLPFETVTDSLVITGPAGRTPDPIHPVRWHRRDWTWLRARGRFERTVLGGENLDDAKWFEWLGRAWAMRLRPHSRNAANELSVRCRGLGGATAWQEVPHESSDGDPVLCILDSDRAHPAAELGGTARKLDKALRSAADVQRLLHVEHLRAHELENVLPLELVRTACRDDAWVSPMAKRGFFARSEVDPALAFIDLGRDQCERRLLDTDDPATSDYRAAALAKIRSNDPSCVASAETCELDADAAPKCTGKRTLPPSCVIVHSVGKPLRRILDELDAEQKSPAASRAAGSVAAWLDSLLPSDDPTLLTPARLAWSWGLCARPRIRSA